MHLRQHGQHTTDAWPQTLQRTFSRLVELLWCRFDGRSPASCKPLAPSSLKFLSVQCCGSRGGPRASRTGRKAPLAGLLHSQLRVMRLVLWGRLRLDLVLRLLCGWRGGGKRWRLRVAFSLTALLQRVPHTSQNSTRTCRRRPLTLARLQLLNGAPSLSLPLREARRHKRHGGHSQLLVLPLAVKRALLLQRLLCGKLSPLRVLQEPLHVLGFLFGRPSFCDELSSQPLPPGTEVERGRHRSLRPPQRLLKLRALVSHESWHENHHLYHLRGQAHGLPPPLPPPPPPPPRENEQSHFHEREKFPLRVARPSRLFACQCHTGPQQVTKQSQASQLLTSLSQDTLGDCRV